MLEMSKEIVIAMLQNGYFPKTAYPDKNVTSVNKALKEIFDQLYALQNSK